ERGRAAEAHHGKNVASATRVVSASVPEADPFDLILQGESSALIAAPMAPAAPAVPTPVVVQQPIAPVAAFEPIVSAAQTSPAFSSRRARREAERAEATTSGEVPVMPVTERESAVTPASSAAITGTEAPVVEPRATERAPSRRRAASAGTGESFRRAHSDDGAPRRSSYQPQPSTQEPAKRGRRAASRRPMFIASGAALALIPGLIVAAPANAVEPLSAAQLKATIASNTQLISQKLTVSSAVDGSSVQKENYVAGAIAGIVAAESGPNGSQVAVALAEALQYGGAREKIVEKALTYLGDPYELGGSTHNGIDCSGLTMVAYATVGVSLVHYVPSQDDVATQITEAQAQPGDLVFFDNDDHVGLYLGGGMLIEAPDYGIPVRIVSVSSWDGIPYHFGRILNG
ncbi:MAG TPA: NlpC/P60 family protein, partial [Humibacter sp.]|nr:NlpC/P60 family protein [Humibacter sp.]